MKAGEHKQLTGKQYGDLTVVQYAGKAKTRHSLWECICNCGEISIVRQSNLVSGKTRSCGCKEGCRKHELSHHRLYRIWQGMKNRCYDHRTNGFSNYGGRGITVYDQWLNDFEAFYNWAMNNGYSHTLTIDRIDNNAGYSPSNCRWATKLQQTENRRKKYVVT